MKLHNFLQYYTLGSQSLFCVIANYSGNFVTFQAGYAAARIICHLSSAIAQPLLYTRNGLDLFLRRGAKNFLFLSKCNTAIIEFVYRDIRNDQLKGKYYQSFGCQHLPRPWSFWISRKTASNNCLKCAFTTGEDSSAL